MDGTLADTVDDLQAALNYALRAAGYPERTRGETLRFVGNGLVKLLYQGLPEEGKGRAEELYPLFRSYYEAHSADKTKPYEGIAGVVKALSEEGYLLAVVSNKSESILLPLVKRFFGEVFQAVIGQREGVSPKPSPDSTFLALGTLGVQKEEAVYIGDSDVDLMTAKNAGLKCISCSWGFKTREELEGFGAERIADKPLELIPLINLLS